MNPAKLNEVKIDNDIQLIMKKIHYEGAINGEDLESISYAKHFYPQILLKYEPQLMYLLGLFFKASEPKDVLSLTYKSYEEYINKEIGIGLSPIQASIKKSIGKNDVFSFSAPTSAGKSHLFRDLIISSKGDIVFVVPSRSLLNEYYIRINEIVSEDNDVLVLQFFENINREKTKKRIFIVTPERASELFKFSSKDFNIELFLFDEAQLSEDEKRGVIFDALVRRVKRKIPFAKIVFAHPFIENPSAQLQKHSLQGESQAFKHQTVGKIFIEKKGSEAFYFSPYMQRGHIKKNQMKIENDPVVDIIKKGLPILIYISKNKIYKKVFLEEFSEYLSLLEELKDPIALNIIDQVENLLAAEGKHSLMVSLMKKGVLIHHGSIPLQVRYLLEQFANRGHSKICFSTSTLLQGVNMPFFAVWLNGAKFSGTQEEKELSLKNLIGRAGRTSKNPDNFDYGIVIVNESKSFSKKINSQIQLKQESLLDVELRSGDIREIEDEFKNSLKKDQINDSYDLPEPRLERLKTKESISTINYILNEMFVERKILTQSEYRDWKESKRKKFKEAFKYIFEISLLRKLNKAEQSILSTSISILLWQIQGRSFKEILKMRHGYVTKLKERKKIEALFERNEISEKEYDQQLDEIECEISPEPREIPNSSLEKGSSYSFKNTKVMNFDYDLLVYDTYDYLDKVIGFSLSKVYYAAFYSYYSQTFDERAFMVAQYFKYGTNDEVDIWLLKYGFSFEEIDWIREHVDYVTQDKIFFLDSIKKLSQEQAKVLKKYL